MRIVVPFAASNPKTRLSAVIRNGERETFARLLLDDVLSVLRTAGYEPTVLSTGPIDVDGPVTVDDRPLTPAVNAVLSAADEPVAIVMGDLGLVDQQAINRLMKTPGEIVLAPGRAGGSNAIVARRSEFRVDYHGASYLDHLASARDIGATVGIVDSFRLATDIDEPADLVELLLHGEGAAATWLRDRGFSLDRTGGRVSLDCP